MLNEFLDWLFGYGREGIYLLFIFSTVFAFLGIVVAFVAFVMPMPLLRFELLMFAINFSIFITWYFKVYRK